VQRRQEFVQIAEMVLAELAGCVAERFERCGKRAGLVRDSDIGAGLADCRQACAERNLAGDEIGAAGRAARFSVVVGEAHAIGGELVEIRRLAGHDALVIGADVEPADIVAHDDQDVRLTPRRRLLRLRHGCFNSRTERRCRGKRCAGQKHVAPIDYTTV
jgi:hypothetical protein